MIKKYLVAYTLEKISKDTNGKIQKDYFTEYEVFIEGDTSEENYKLAQKRYEELLNEEGDEFTDTTSLWSASLTEIIKSTDY